MKAHATHAEATILLVDDNPANLGVLTQLLTAQGWRVLVAQQGESGLQIAQRTRPDLILLDVLLPGMDGFETCRRLKSQADTAETPVLFMTMLTDAADKLKGFVAGGVDYITKPFQAEEVLARVTTHLRLRQLAHRLQEQNTQLQVAQAALRMANEELERRVQERTQRLEILHAIDQAILAAQSAEAIAHAALGHMCALVPCSWASVAMLDSDAREIAVLAIHANGHVEPAVHTSGALAPIEIADALRRGEVQVVQDTAMLTMPAVIAAPVSAPDMRSYVNVPLIAAGDLLGILTVGSEHSHVFTPAHVAIACEVASQIAVAMQNARLFADMSAARAHLQAVSRQLVAVQEAERARIARDLHDEIGQMLTGLKLVLAIGTRSKPAQDPAWLAEAQALINDLTTRVREISLDLRPAMLDDLGLLPTLLWHVKRYTEQTQIQVSMKHTGLDLRAAPDVEIAVYRLVQEGLTNVARHADVSDVEIWLWRTADSIGVRIKDQGRGFIPEQVLAAHTSSGLAGMIERVRLLGGQLTIESAPGQGTRLTAELPLEA
jgi:signal transduction histidine kinase